MILKRSTLRAAAGLVLLLTGATPSMVWAQSAECDQLRQDLAVAGRADPQRRTQFVRAAQRQQMELARTQAYASQIGCSRGFSIFGSDGPAQCDTIESQIDRMSANLETLQQQIAQLADIDPRRQAALEEQYRATCGLGVQNITPDGVTDDAMRPGFDDPNADQPQDGVPHHSGKAICVRTCDGGFFPLTFSPAERDEAGLQNLCTALCPNTEAKLYTTPDLDNISAAVAIDGASYADLPNAFRYQKSFDPTCTCKPPNKSWVEALADAEKLLDKGSSKDVTVTAKMSDEMARPVAATPAPTSTKKKGFSKAQIKALLDAQAAAEGALGAVGAQAPTASTESAGIAGDAGASSDHTVKTDEGAVKSVPGPDGAKRRVRIVGPTL